MNPKTLLLILSSSLFSTLQASQLTGGDSSITDPLLSVEDGSNQKDLEYFMPRRLVTNGKAPVAFMEKYNPDHLPSSVPMQKDKYADPENQDNFATVHRENLEILLNPKAARPFSFSWILHLAHLNDFSEIYQLGKSDTVRASLASLRESLNRSENYRRYLQQNAFVRDIHHQLSTGLRSAWSKSLNLGTLKDSLETQFGTLESFAKAHFGMVKAIEFVLDRMDKYENHQQQLRG